VPPPVPVSVEVCVDSVDGCVAARAAGADRVELCAGLVEGGTTPSAGLVSAACERAGVDVVVLVRPRAGDFAYADAELEVMRRDIAFARRAGASGVALGVLAVDGTVDAPRTEELAALARPMAVTFHRAFDLVRDRIEALRALASLGVDRILTSGGAPSARIGAPAIAELVRAAPDTLEIVAAGGIREPDVQALLADTGARAVHFAARRVAPSPMVHRVDGVRMGASDVPGEYDLVRSDADAIRAIVRAARGPRLG
jgi:copper homeostasis protein